MRRGAMCGATMWGAASVLQEHGLPGAEEHAQLVPGLEGLGEALQQLKQSLPSAPAADAVCTAPVLESMVQGGLEVDPAIPTTLGTEYLLQQINQHESKLQEALVEKGRKRLRELESLLSQRLYDYVEDRFLWGYRIDQCAPFWNAKIKRFHRFPGRPAGCRGTFFISPRPRGLGNLHPAGGQKPVFVRSSLFFPLIRDTMKKISFIKPFMAWLFKTERGNSKMSKSSKKIIGIVLGVILVVIVVGLVAVMALRIDSAEAEQIALEQAGGGEIVEREVSSEGLWNEYSYTVQNGDTWYEIEIGGFGQVGELKSGTGDSWKY